MKIKSTTTKEVSVIMDSTPRRLNLRVICTDGAYESTVHCGLDVAKFSGLKLGISLRDFSKLLDKNGFDTNQYAHRTIVEILDKYNAVLAQF